MKQFCILLALCLLFTRSAAALGPHEILLIVNSDSEDSVLIATQFIRLRQVPHTNIVTLALGKDIPREITPKEFTTKIWEPASRAMEERGLKDQIQAWIYSAGIPTTIKTTPPISITGATFVRNQPLSTEQIDKALYVSPLFAGPLSAKEKAAASRTLDVSRSWLGNEMPLPAMMLAVTGPNASSRSAALSSISQGRKADGTAPTGTIYFVKTDDPRSHCREWQFQPATDALLARGIHAVIQDKFPENQKNVLGFMTGLAHVKPAEIGTLLPGAFAEHLTSLAGMFTTEDQTKLTAWIEAGATMSAGTVSEPYSAWIKFPHAFFFVHYAAGCTAIESFYQSVRSPLQILPVGDPLCAPWAPKTDVVVTGLKTPAEPSTMQLETVVHAPPLERYSKILYFVDSKPTGEGPSLTLDTTSLAPGQHTLRVVTLHTGLVKSQAFVELPFVVLTASAK